MNGLNGQLLGLLRPNKPHRRPADRFADGFSIISVVLVRLDVWRHELRADQPHLMAKLREHASPIVCPVRSLHAHQAWRQGGEKARHGISSQRLSQDDLAARIDTVNSKDVFRQIQTYSNDLHDILLRS